MLRRAAPFVLVAAIAGLLLSYVVYTRRVVEQLQREAVVESVMYARIWRALSDTTEALSTEALLDLSRYIVDKGVPVVVMSGGAPSSWENVPGSVVGGEEGRAERLREYALRLDADNPPVVVPGVGTVHFGNTLLVRGLRIIPLVQAALIVLLAAAAWSALRARGRAERERTWAGMAREAAHQLGTPLTSLSGWVELLAESPGPELAGEAIGHLRGDLERLERVAHRFERIGTPPRRAAVELVSLAGRCVDYFRVRAPKLAKAVRIDFVAADESVVVQGDAVLLEWALEAVLKNALDALGGRGGAVTVTVERLLDGGARVRVEDDGPGIPRELRTAIFEPGVTTKPHGWGIGLSLARRIVEENHHGTLLLVPTDRGATFDIILPA